MNDETEYISEGQEARIDAGDQLDPAEVCSFLTHDSHPEQGPCAQQATSDRLIEDVLMRACTHHAARGGILHADARRHVVRELVKRQNIDAARSITTDDGERVTFPRFCGSCGARLFTGNISGVCVDCSPELVMTGARLVAEHTGRPEWLVESDRMTAEDVRNEHYDNTIWDRD